MTRPVDLKSIAETALESFPLGLDGMDPAGDYAQRLLTKELSRLRKAGCALDTASVEAWRDELDRLILETRENFIPKPVAKTAKAARARQPALEIDVDTLVDDAFSAPYDGTRRRAEVLAARARGNVENALDRESLGWIRRMLIRRKCELAIKRNLADLVDH